MMPTGDYKVEKKEELRKIVKDEVEVYYRVWATSKGGTYFHVDLSEKDLPKEKADAILTKRAKELDAI